MRVSYVYVYLMFACMHMYLRECRHAQTHPFANGRFDAWSPDDCE